MNRSLKVIISGSLLALVLGAVGIGAYVWNLNRTTMGNNTKKVESTTIKPVEAKVGKVETFTVTKESINSDGTIDVSKYQDK